MRLARIRDINKNIVKEIGYKFGDVFTFTYGNAEQISNATKSCASGYVGSVPNPYKVLQNTYGSFLSVNDANAKAIKDVQDNGQAWADSTGFCQPYYDFLPEAGTIFTNLFDNFSLTGTGGVNFQFAVAKATSWALNNSYQAGTVDGALFLPSTIQNINVTSAGSNFQIQFYPNGLTLIKWTGGATPQNNIANVSGVYNL